MREHIGLATSAYPVWEILYGALYVLKGGDYRLSAKSTRWTAPYTRALHDQMIKDRSSITSRLGAVPNLRT